MRILWTNLNELADFHDNINKLRKSYDILLALTRGHEKVVRSFILFRERILRPGGPQGGIPVQFLTYFDGCLTFRHACKPVRAERACLHCCASSPNVTAVWVDLLWGEGENAMNAISTLVLIFVDCSKFCVQTPILDICLESLFEFKISLLDYVTVSYILNMPFIFFMIERENRCN